MIVNEDNIPKNNVKFIHSCSRSILVYTKMFYASMFSIKEKKLTMYVNHLVQKGLTVYVNHQNLILLKVHKLKIYRHSFI